MSLAETEANITMFNYMIKKQVSTNDVRHFIVKQAAQCRVYKQTNRRLERVAMHMKRSDAIALAKRLRQQKHRSKTSIRHYFDREIANNLIDKINRKASVYRRDLIIEKKDKELLPCKN